MSLTKAAVLFCSTTLFLSQWHCSNSYVAIGLVPVENGKCRYNGTEIPPGEPLKLEHPCEEWDCDPSTGELSVTGCNPVEPGRGCILIKGRGVYPECCGQVACY
ncbi:complement inhibitor CirpT1-like [Dermacentor variabilis]|uniref:complement inhibitor CirpT1-like n=1 Tax=Dermacentor variabilis TaxID=34621 RepID=UPI003F5C5CDF